MCPETPTTSYGTSPSRRVITECPQLIPALDFFLLSVKMAQAANSFISTAERSNSPKLTTTTQNNCNIRRLFVSRLPRRGATQEAIASRLKQVFDGVTDVLCLQAGDDQQRRGLLNRGYCFVDFDTHEHAAAALHGVMSLGITPFANPLYADWSMPLNQQIDDDVKEKLHTLFVMHLHPCQTELELTQACRRACSGFCKVWKKTHGGYAFIEFNTHEQAENFLARYGESGSEQLTVAGRLLPKLAWAHPDLNQNNRNDMLRMRQQQRLQKYRTKAQDYDEQGTTQSPQTGSISKQHDSGFPSPLPGMQGTVFAPQHTQCFFSQHAAYGLLQHASLGFNNYHHVPMSPLALPLTSYWQHSQASQYTTAFLMPLPSPLVMGLTAAPTQPHPAVQGAFIYAPDGSRVFVVDSNVYKAA